MTLPGPITPQRLRVVLEPHGLTVRGWFWPKPGENSIPIMPDGTRPGTLVLVGNVGGSMWEPFSRAPEASLVDNPLDRWTRRILTTLASQWGAGVCFPFGPPPFSPFQAWSKRVETVFDSPLGLLIHPRFGLWHAYRGVFLLPNRWPAPVLRPPPSPCLSCPFKPCLSACPVHAFTLEGFLADRCRWHIGAPQGETCLKNGCLARAICPVGREFIYPSDQIEFHMRAFLKAGQG